MIDQLKTKAMKSLLNPTLPENFFSTDNDDRSDAEIAEWWDRPFILEQKFFFGGAQTQFPDAAERREAQEKQWLSRWPSGSRFDVWILDGGAWDRPTNRGQFDSLDEAVERCFLLAPEVVAKLQALELSGVAIDPETGTAKKSSEKAKRL